MEKSIARSHRTVILAALAIVLALVVAIIFVRAHAAHVERARLEARVDELSKQMTTLQTEMATAPSSEATPNRTDAAVGDYPTPFKKE